MKITINANTVVGGIGMGVGILGLGFALGSQNQINKVQSRLDESVDNYIANGITIPESMIRESVDRSVDRRAEDAIRKAVSDEVITVRKNAFTCVRKAVDEEVSRVQGSLEGDVKRELNRCLDGIDISKARDEVIKAASERAAERFDADLERLVEAHSAELQNVNKIYTAIAKNITGDSDGQTIRLRIS